METTYVLFFLFKSIYVSFFPDQSKYKYFSPIIKVLSILGRSCCHEPAYRDDGPK